MTLRAIVLTGSIALLGLGCQTAYFIQPATGEAYGAASSQGLSLVADPEAWGGEPSDLADYLTPISIEIVNRHSGDIRISYADFALVDGDGFRYAAISPYSGQASMAPGAPPNGAEPARPSQNPSRGTTPNQRQAPASSPTEDEPSGGDPPPTSTDPPQHDSAWIPGRPLGPQTEPWYAWRRLVKVDPGPLHVAARGRVPINRPVRVVPRPGIGFHPHPHFHRYFPHYHPWPYRYYYWPPYYGGWVYFWDYRYYPSAPSYDVMRLGLPQGVVRAGGRVSGFVYFQNAAARATRLQLTWAAHDVRGQRVATLSIPLVVVEA
jgi:hypothetical protein